MKSRNREIGCNNDHIAQTFNMYLGSSAANMPVKYLSDWKSLNPNLTASRLYENLGKTFVRLEKSGPDSGWCSHIATAPGVWSPQPYYVMSSSCKHIWTVRTHATKTSINEIAETVRWRGYRWFSFWWHVYPWSSVKVSGLHHIVIWHCRKTVSYLFVQWPCSVERQRKH